MLRLVMMAGGADIPPEPIHGFAANVLALSPWGYWRLDDASGSVAIDSSGNGRHGAYGEGKALNGAALYPGTGASVFSDGISGISLPDLDVPQAGPRRLSVLVTYSTPYSGPQQLLSADGVSSGWALRIASGGGQASVTTTTPSATTTTGSGAAYGGAHMLVAVFDDALSSGAVKIYVNGVLNGASSLGGLAYGEPGAVLNPAIGARSSTSNDEAFYGTLDDCAIFRDALTAEQVATLWAERVNA